MLGTATPGDAENYCFEPCVTKTGSGRGFADVWKRGHFAWEYKAPGKNLDAALKQLMMYALPLEIPFPDELTPACTADKKVATTTTGALIPTGLAPAAIARATAVADAAKRLYDLREAWLNPLEWTERRPDIIPLGMTASPYPPRISARAGLEAEVAKRTLTKLYNAMPAWLQATHQQLDKAVVEAYGWTDHTPAMTESEARTRLLKLNLSRVGTSA